MSRVSRFTLLVAIFTLIASLFVGTFAANADSREVCPEGRPTAQVRFQNFPDIPVYTAAADAEQASRILAGEVAAEQIPQPAFRIRGGNQMKYLLCGAYDEDADAVRIIINGSGSRYVPAFLVSDVVGRNVRDGRIN